MIQTSADLRQNWASRRQLCFQLLWFLLRAFFSSQPKSTNKIKIKTVEKIISGLADGISQICISLSCWQFSIHVKNKNPLFRNLKILRDCSDIMKTLSQSQMSVLCRLSLFCKKFDASLSQLHWKLWNEKRHGFLSEFCAFERTFENEFVRTWATISQLHQWGM